MLCGEDIATLLAAAAGCAGCIKLAAEQVSTVAEQALGMLSCRERCVMTGSCTSSCRQRSRRPGAAAAATYLTRDLYTHMWRGHPVQMTWQLLTPQSVLQVQSDVHHNRQPRQLLLAEEQEP